MTPLERLAAIAAIEAPAKRSHASVCAAIDWDTIEEIRIELERVGFDWRAAKATADRLVRERRAARVTMRATGGTAP